MAADPRVFLWDVLDAIDAIGTFTKGRSLADYLADLMLRSAVERQLEIIGEALNRLSKTSPPIAERIPELRRAVAFRNLLIHGYEIVKSEVVWDVIVEDLPALRLHVAARLDELGR